MANSEGYDSSSDFIYYRPTLLGSIFPITFTIFFQDLLNSKYQQTIINLMRLRELITVQNILHAALYTGYQYSIEITDESISFELKTDPEIVRKQLWSHPSTSPRTQQYSLLPDEWNYAAQELMAEGRQRVWSGEEKSSKNLTWFNKQFDSILGSYLILPNYSETFERWFGFPLLEFFNTIKSLMEISYYCVRSVAILTLRRAEVLVSKKTSYSRSRVRGLLSKLIYDGEGHPSKYPLIYVKPNLIISHTRLSQVFSNLMGGCIEEEYEPALKGPVFEEQCREIIRGRKIFVMPTNIEITEPYLPPTISMQLWGKEKEGTDLDVLAASNKLILLIEAKQRKYSETQARRHVSMKNQMEKFQNDLFRKAYWLSNNWNHFLANYLDPKYHNEFRNCECLLPFIVSTYASDKIETAPPVMTIKELDSLLDIFQKKKFFDKISQNRRTAKINGTEFELQFFKVIR